MKLTVQVVLHADDTETVIREVRAVQREEPLAPDTESGTNWGRQWLAGEGARAGV